MKFCLFVNYAHSPSLSYWNGLRIGFILWPCAKIKLISIKVLVVLLFCLYKCSNISVFNGSYFSCLTGSDACERVSFSSEALHVKSGMHTRGLIFNKIWAVMISMHKHFKIVFSIIYIFGTLVLILFLQMFMHIMHYIIIKNIFLNYINIQNLLNMHEILRNQTCSQKA